MCGVALAVGWSLFAAWLTPEVYVAGITGAEVYTLASTMPGAPASAAVLTWIALGGLALGGAVSALASLRGLSSVGRDVARGSRRRLALIVVASAGVLTCLVPPGAGTLLLMALGLAASTLAPAAVLACWSERATPHSTAGGAGLGLVAFVLLIVTGSRPRAAWPRDGEASRWRRRQPSPR
jgi:Na+(H+)/acetate symporter ActP